MFSLNTARVLMARGPVTQLIVALGLMTVCVGCDDDTEITACLLDEECEPLGPAMACSPEGRCVARAGMPQRAG